MTDAAQPDPEGAVIIPHYNDVARLARCLDALARAAPPRPTEIVVADNDSTDDIRPLRARHPGVRFLIETERGAAAVRNAGVAATCAPRIFLLDCDCVPEPDWLAVAYEVIEGRDIVGGAMHVFDETAPPRSGAEAFEAVFAFDQESYIEKKRFAVTANLLTWRHVWEDVGPLRAGLSEDLEWCKRAAAKGYRLVYEPRLAVGHPSRSDWPALRRKWLRLTRESYSLTAGAPQRRLRWGLRAVAVLLSPGVHAWHMLCSPKLAGVERWRGLATLVRQRAARSAWMLRQSLGGELPEK